MRQLIILLTLLLGLNGAKISDYKNIDLNIAKFKQDISRIITARQKTGDLWRELGINKQSKRQEQKIITELNGLLGKLPGKDIKKTMTERKERDKKTMTERKERDKNDINKNWFRFSGLKY